LRAGDAVTGITIMQMDAGLDTGPMLTWQSLPILADDTGHSLHDKMARLGADLLLATLPDYLAGKITPQPQDDAQATFAPQINKADGRIDWSQPAAAIERLVRAFTPWPGTFTLWHGKPLKIHRGRAGTGSAQPGRVLSHEGHIAIGTGAGLYYPLEVQAEGKKRTDITAFVNGYQDFTGALLDEPA
jgi:methionyl-tRNA formyltransferase